MIKKKVYLLAKEIVQEYITEQILIINKYEHQEKIVREEKKDFNLLDVLPGKIRSPILAHNKIITNQQLVLMSDFVKAIKREIRKGQYKKHNANGIYVCLRYIHRIGAVLYDRLMEYINPYLQDEKFNESIH